MIHMLAERFQYTKKVGALKAKLGLPSADPEREAEQVARLRHLASVTKLDPDFAEKFLAFVIREVIRHPALEVVAEPSPTASALAQKPMLNCYKLDRTNRDLHE
jgi:chorismate mutase